MSQPPPDRAVTRTLPAPMPASPSSAVCRVRAERPSADSGAVTCAPKAMAKAPVAASSVRRCASELVAPVRIVVRDAVGAGTGSKTTVMTGMVCPTAAPPNAMRHWLVVPSSVTVAVAPVAAKVAPLASTAFRMAVCTAWAPAWKSMAPVV